jgi:hypothetical protein
MQSLSGLKDAIAGRRLSAGDIGDQEGRIFQGSHAEIRCFLQIGDTHEEVTGLGALKGGGVDQHKAIFSIHRLNDSNKSRHLSLRRFCFTGKKSWDAPKPGEDARDERPL